MALQNPALSLKNLPSASASTATAPIVIASAKPSVLNKNLRAGTMTTSKTISNDAGTSGMSTFQSMSSARSGCVTSPASRIAVATTPNN